MQRYNLGYHCIDHDGEFCKYKDHAEIVAKLEAELEHREKIWLSRLKEQDERYAKLEAENDLLRKYLKAKDELLVCYRIGKKPSEKTLDNLYKLKKALEE